MAKVSVIIPVYNCAKYLPKCVDSVLSQTMKDLEVILVDDGSTDGSGEICDRYAGEGVIVIHQENQGPSAARNAGLERVTGEYVAFVDGDDYVDVTTYEEMYSIARDHDVDVVVCNYAIEEDGKRISKPGPCLPEERLVEKPELRKLLIGEKNETILWFAVKSIFRRKLLSDYGIRWMEGKIIGEDTVFNLEAFLCAQNAWYVNKAFYTYVQTPGSQIRTKYKPGLWERMNHCYLAKKELYEKHQLQGYEKELNSYNLRHSIVMLLSNEMNHSCPWKEKGRAYREMRECEMVTETLQAVNVRELRYRIRFMVILLKWRAYGTLALIDCIKGRGNKNT